jgi:hypothetical protein
MAAAELEHDAWYQAVAAIDAGDVQRLQGLIAAHPRLITDRLDGSPEWLRRQAGDAAGDFFRHPYLLWFVAEDPVRNGRLPSNIAEITTSRIPTRHGGCAIQKLPRIFATPPHRGSESMT